MLYIPTAAVAFLVYLIPHSTMNFKIYSLIIVHLVNVVINQINSKKFVLLCKAVSDFHVPMVEPWGSGSFVHSIEFEKCLDKRIKTTIILNFGDEITCVSEMIKMMQSN